MPELIPSSGEPSDVTLFRSLTVGEGQVDEENRSIRFPVVSDSRVEIFRGYYEILSHRKGALRMGKRQQSLSLLFNHDWDKLLGIVDKIEQDEHRTYVTVRFAKTEEGDKALQLVRDRVLVNVSCGYRVYKYEESGENERTVTDWEIHEVSLVTVPADPSVGVYRSLNVNPKERKMPEGVKQDPVTKTPAEPKQPDVKVVDEDTVRSLERQRISEIDAMCRSFNVDDNLRNQMISEGKSVDEARAMVMEQLKTRRLDPAGDSGRGMSEELGLTEKEKQSYSLLRAINASITGDWSRAGFEREVSRTIARRLNKETTGLFMPTDIPFIQGARDYSVGTAANGGNLVETELLSGSFIEMLRAKSMVLQLGATLLTGLRGNIEIPRQNGASTTYWVKEDGEVTKSSGTFDLVSMSPKTVGARSYITRNLLLQSSISAENFVRMDLLTSLGLAVDLSALSGTGADGQPKGIAKLSNIYKVEGGTNGGAITFDHLIDMETAVADANADVRSMAYLANAKTIGALKKIKDSNGNYIWKAIAGGFKNGIPGEVNGYPMARSNQCRSNLTKGTASAKCSELFFGNWSDILIGEWGVLEILANPYSDTAFSRGGVEIRAMQSIDVAVRHEESFSYFGDILTDAVVQTSSSDNEEETA